MTDFLRKAKRVSYIFTWSLYLKHLPRPE